MDSSARQHFYPFDESSFRRNHKLSSDIDISVIQLVTRVQPDGSNNSWGSDNTTCPSPGRRTDELQPPPAVETQKETADTQTQKRQHDYDLRTKRKKTDVYKAGRFSPKKRKMKPYKKRSFYPNQRRDIGMENENSDDSEKQVSPPPLLEETEREKDKEGETKPKKKWQRKISRKQFRHHDIKLFTPGELKTPTLLKYNDSGPPHLKKQNVSSKESITESILYSLGGQKQAFAQKAKQLEEASESSASTNETEENNNVNDTNNNNNTFGKHQLPAIVIMETPVGRRRSTESIHTSKPNQTKNSDQPKPKKVHRGRPAGTKSYASMPKLQPITKPSVVQNPPKLKVQNEELPEQATNAINNNFVDNKSRTRDLENKEASSRVLAQENRPPRPMEFENVSLKRRYSAETPVDLSKRRTLIGTEPATSETQPSSHSNIPDNYNNNNNNNVGARREEPQNFQSVIAENSGSRQSLNNNDALSMYAKEFERIFNNPLRNPTEAPPTYPLGSHPQSISQNLLTDTVIRMAHLNRWQDALQNLLRQQFNLQILDMMSQAYQQLDTIKDETLITADAKLRAQKVLTDTYDFISAKLKQFGLSLNPIEVIKIMGQSNANPEKNMLQTNLETIQGLQNLNLNQVPVPTSTNPFVVPQSGHAPTYRGLTRSPPPLFGSNLAQTRPSRIPNGEHSVPKMPSPRTDDDLAAQKMRPDVQHAPTFRQPRRPIDPSSFLPPRFGSIKNPIQFPVPTPAPPTSYMNYAVNGIRQESRLNQATQAERVTKNCASRSRSMSQRHNGARAAQPQLNRAMSDPAEKNYALAYSYMNGNGGVTQARIPPNHNPFLGPQNVFRESHLRATTSSASRNPNVQAPMYSEAVFRQTVPNHMFNGANTYNRHPVPGPLKDLIRPPAQPGPSDLPAYRNKGHRVSLDVQPKVRDNCHKSVIHSENNISSSTDHVELSKILINSRHRAIEKQRGSAEPLPAQVKETPIATVPAVIVADTSMQITKEPTQPVAERITPQDPIQETNVRQTVITTSSENASCSEEKAPNSEERTSSSEEKTSHSEEIAKNPPTNDQEENNAEFLIWLDKLKSNKKLKRKFLSQMGINNREPLAGIKYEECIEIMDSDEETSVETKDIKEDTDDAKEPMPVDALTSEEPIEISSRPRSRETENKQTKLPHNQPNSQEAIITTTTVPGRSLKIITPAPPNGNITKLSPKPSLSSRNYVPPIALPYVQTPITQSQGEYRSGTSDQQKVIYSPEIELISPVGNEPSFTFPEVPITSAKILTTSVASPTYSQKRKTPIALGDYQSKGTNSPNRATCEDATKRRKSLDRPQITASPRVPPSGKLCYVRESHMFLRYFDDIQMELFIANLSSKDEELLRTTGVDPEKIKNSPKHANFGLEQLGQTDIVHLPREVEFSRKADLQDVEEFVKESNLVEQFVPKDFADFYRYVTGFQIIKNKHPVSLQTFLTMYNTNRTTELLRKYLQRRDEDSSVVVISK